MMNDEGLKEYISYIIYHIIKKKITIQLENAKETKKTKPPRRRRRRFVVCTLQLYVQYSTGTVHVHYTLRTLNQSGSK